MCSQRAVQLDFKTFREIRGNIKSWLVSIIHMLGVIIEEMSEHLYSLSHSQRISANLVHYITLKI